MNLYEKCMCSGLRQHQFHFTYIITMPRKYSEFSRRTPLNLNRSLCVLSILCCEPCACLFPDFVVCLFYFIEQCSGFIIVCFNYVPYVPSLICKIVIPFENFKRVNNDFFSYNIFRDPEFFLYEETILLEAFFSKLMFYSAEKICRLEVKYLSSFSNVWKDSIGGRKVNTLLLLKPEE